MIGQVGDVTCRTEHRQNQNNSTIIASQVLATPYTPGGSKICPYGTARRLCYRSSRQQVAAIVHIGDTYATALIHKVHQGYSDYEEISFYQLSPPSLELYPTEAENVQNKYCRGQAPIIVLVILSGPSITAWAQTTSSVAVGVG